MDEKTLCPAAIRAFDGKDSAQTQEFLRFVQNVFDELDAQSRERGEPALKTKLIDMSVEGSIILGFLPPASNRNDLRSDSGCLSRLEVAAQAYDRHSHRETASSDRGYVSLPIAICFPARVRRLLKDRLNCRCCCRQPCQSMRRRNNDQHRATMPDLEVRKAISVAVSGVHGQKSRAADHPQDGPAERPPRNGQFKRLGRETNLPRRRCS